MEHRLYFSQKTVTVYVGSLPLPFTVITLFLVAQFRRTAVIETYTGCYLVTCQNSDFILTLSCFENKLPLLGRTSDSGTSGSHGLSVTVTRRVALSFGDPVFLYGLETDFFYYVLDSLHSGSAFTR